MAERNGGIGWREIGMDVGAVLSFALTLWLAIEDKASSATVTGLMAVGFAALRHLPLIDTIEAFGLKAKLRQTVSEADDLLTGLRTATSTASKLAYFQLAYIGRMASPTWDYKRDLLGQVDEGLRKTGGTEAEIAPLREPIIRFLLADIYYLLRRIVSHRVNQRQREIRAEQNALFGNRPIPAGDPNYTRLSEELHAMRDMESLGNDLMANPKLACFAELITQQLEQTGLPPDDLAKLRPLAMRFGLAGQAAWSKMQLTDDAFAIARAQNSEQWQPYFVEVFGEEPK
ncbi:MAG: hypothetical protein KJ944_08160 [Alphaproteobacteria bacterium]|nr:hypothetical protein [Alphaproteobacteria bacterium]MBU1561436.1 hypothetical protein [Alphaproteobacteria bacterium]MBU2302556.1 hypothetical protein [Alphaproteobacteria bacterium]MBU2367544.1 hypothetical protein [Alphaproteobacteria bacterium]